jgi:hypothetical protein
MSSLVQFLDIRRKFAELGSAGDDRCPTYSSIAVREALVSKNSVIWASFPSNLSACLIHQKARQDFLYLTYCTFWPETPPGGFLSVFN